MPADLEPVPASEYVTSKTARRWVQVHGEVARVWLSSVPGLVASWAARWELEVTGRLGRGSMSVVVAATAAGRDVVLKLTAPWVPRPADEADALDAWAGDGAVELLDRSPDGTALLLERIAPGTAGAGLTADEVAGLAARLAAKRPPPGLADMAAAVDYRFRRAEENRHRLLTPAQHAAAREAALAWASAYDGPSALVHGDLLAANVLRCARRGWVAIDPTPWAGDPAFDVALWALTTPPIEAAHERVVAAGGRVERAAGWVTVLAAVEACLAPVERAEASLRLARLHRAAWLDS